MSYSTENYEKILFIPETLKCWVGVQRGQSYFMGRRCLFSLGYHPSSDGVTIKMPYRVDVLQWPALWPIFSCWFGSAESGFIVRSVETGSGRWMLVVAVISVDLPFFDFFRPDLSPWGYRNRCFLVALCCLIVRRPNLEVATKRLLHQQVKIPG